MNLLKLFHLFTVFFIILAISSCSNSGSSGSNGALVVDTGRVSLLITDGVTDKFDQINLTVQSISFVKADDDGQETIVFDKPQVINLLALQSYSNLLVTTAIPVGVYEKIRLRISQVELVRFVGEDNKSESSIAKLPANGKVDLNPRGSFEVTAEGHLMIELDVDADKSILVIKKGNGKDEYNFRPVIFVKILGVDKEKSRLVLIDGKVLTRKEAGFQLCTSNKEHDEHDDEYESDDDEAEYKAKDKGDHETERDDDRCMVVLISENTVIQNSLIESVLESELEQGDVVTVLGKANGHGIDALHVVIEAKNKEISELALFTGDATSAVDGGNNFTMNRDDKAAIQSLTALAVSLVDGSAVRVFDKNGTEVKTDLIVVGSAVDVFGLAMPDVHSAEKIKAAFVIINNDVKDNKISGTIAAINKDKSQITVTVVSDVFSGDVCVDVKQAALFILDIVDGKVVSKEISINELQADMLIDVYGQAKDMGCVLADVVLLAQPLAVTPVAASLFVRDN